MGRPVPVILNATAGSGAAGATREKLREALAAAGIDAHLIAGEDLSLLARRAVREGHPLVIAAGGDGTVNAVAAQVAGSKSALGVIPLGTLNHFARDIGIPLELDGAVKAIAAGRRERVDVGAVNGRVFVNNSSIGLYPAMVIRREKYRRVRGTGKWTALFWSSLTVLRRHAMLNLTLRVDGVVTQRRTPLVFVGNNEYRIEGLEAGRREGLQDGKLAIYITRRHGRRGLLALGLRAMFASLRDAMDLETHTATTLTIATRRRYLNVATDGEVSVMTTPLEYENRPGALEVIVPPPAEDPQKKE